VTGGIGAAVLVLVLIAVVALAVASFFTNLLVAVLLSLGIPVAVLLHALLGTLYAAFAIAGVAILIALIQTITDTLAVQVLAKMLGDSLADIDRRDVTIGRLLAELDQAHAELAEVRECNRLLHAVHARDVREQEALRCDLRVMGAVARTVCE